MIFTFLGIVGGTFIFVAIVLEFALVGFLASRVQKLETRCAAAEAVLQALDKPMARLMPRLERLIGEVENDRRPGARVH